MKITPLEIRQHEFEKTFRGYNIEEVDNFLANLSQEWERILNESKMLRMQLEMAEKEASKLREIEMTLFKTLKTAEDTSAMITEQANQQADKNITEAKQKSQEILQSAHTEAVSIVNDAQSKARYIKEEVLGEVKQLERDFNTMYQYKTDLLTQMRSLSNATLQHVEKFEAKFDKDDIGEKIKEAFSVFSDKTSSSSALGLGRVSSSPQTLFVARDIPSVEDADITEDTEDIETGSVVEFEIEEENLNTHIDTPESELAAEIEEEVVDIPVLEDEKVDESVKTDELEIIEGIGPKIAMLLYDNGIFTFKDLATTPAYKIGELLENAGPAYAMHDPSTWVEQALLAAEGRFDELDEMKERLIGGRVVEDVEERGIDNTSAFVDAAVEPEEESLLEDEFEVRTSRIEDKVENVNVENSNIEAITEEMLEKVNKVKEAIRKAMVEKDEKPVKDSTPLPTVNNHAAKNNDSEGGSFFDNI